MCFRVNSRIEEFIEFRIPGYQDTRIPAFTVETSTTDANS